MKFEIYEKKSDKINNNKIREIIRLKNKQLNS